MKTFLFDFDGTLVDSMPTFVSVMMRILDENKISYDENLVKIITPLGYVGSAKYFQTLGLNKPIDELVAAMNEYAIYEYENNIVAKQTVIETLSKMKELGYDLNVLTASPHSVLDPCLKRIGIYHLFNNVWSCNDFNTTKADPQIYVKCSERLAKPVNEIIFVDDNINAVKTAKTAGMISYGIYDPSSDEYIEEMKKVSDRFVYTLSELL